MEVIIENIRCFCGEHAIALKPLTILTGENSSGKSTFLSVLSTLSSVKFPFNESFNDYPYELGGYDTVATYKGGSFGRSKTFKLGFKNRHIKMISSFVNDSGRIVLNDMKINHKNIEIIVCVKTLSFESAELSYSVVVDGELMIDKHPMGFPLSREMQQLIPVFVASDAKRRLNEVGFSLEMDDYIFMFSKVVQSISIAPIRTKPLRTYDQIDDSFYPAGRHIPMVLARTFHGADALNKKVLSDSLCKFGAESGLFKEVRVKKLGKTVSDPFQLQVKVGGQYVNIVDVGYGVNQVLPVLVESVNLDSNKYLLLQQPEVHLHPKAQAALGTFFSTLAGKGKKHFVVETHSDYVVDRIRQEIARGIVKPADVAFYYFEKKGYETHIHQLDLDKNGNITNQPDCYREFFIKEEINLLNRTAL